MIDRLSDAAHSAGHALQSQLTALLAGWVSAERLYTLEGEGGASQVGELMVERFCAVDALSDPFQLHLTTLSLNAHIDLHALLGQRITLHTTLSDGSRSARSALIFQAAQGPSDGGLARFELMLQPWIALLGFSRSSRAFQHKTLPQIIDHVLSASAYAGHAAWTWGEEGEDLHSFLAQGPNGGVYPYVAQYRESDLAFVQRLLAQAGIGWRVEQHPDAPSGHRIVFFAHSARCPQDATSATLLGGAGIRFHRGAAVEQQDAIQAFGGLRQLTATASAILQWDYTRKAAVAAEVLTHQTFASDALQAQAPWLQSYDAEGAWADTGALSPAELQHRTTLRQEALEARRKNWLARSTVRTLRPGSWFALTQSTLDLLSALGALATSGKAGSNSATEREFTVHTVHSLGINNLPKDLSQHIARRLGQTDPSADPFADLADDPWGAELFSGDDSLLPGADTGPALAAFTPLSTALTTPDADPRAALAAIPLDPELCEQAAALGYANRFQAIRRSIPWRPAATAQAPAPTALGVQTAIVCGPGGSTSPSGADELYTDALGRIQVQFHWQAAALQNPNGDPRPDNRHSGWLRVAQDWAGPGMGQQFIPRIGQEVIVSFLGNNIDRPIVTGAVYNGRGEAGIAPTPGGKAGETDTAAYAQSSDHRPSAQGNLIGSGSGGHSPAWHGGAPGSASPGAAAQNNAAALSGIKSKEFGGAGANQLVFDDTPGELRVQLASTQHASQLNLGHLIHQADNHRGSYRGTGFELRSDAFGAVRGLRGLLLTTYGLSQADPAGDNAAGLALLKQALTLATTFSQAAATHQTTTLATAIGTQQASASNLSDQAAPMKALHQAAAGMVSPASFSQAQSDAAAKRTQATAGQLPHSTDPIVAISAKAGLGLVAGQDIQWASGEAISWQAGQDTHIASGGQMRVHTGQSLGILAGAVQAGSGEGSAKGTGLTMIAATGPVQMQAQAGPMQVAAKGLINVQTANAHIDFAAAKKITLQTAGGASIVLASGSINVSCPGTLTVHAASKSMSGPGSVSFEPQRLPNSDFKQYDEAFAVVDPSGKPMQGATYKVKTSTGFEFGDVDAKGRSARVATQAAESLQFELRWHEVLVGGKAKS